jgi:hypothetical protein
MIRYINFITFALASLCIGNNSYANENEETHVVGTETQGRIENSMNPLLHQKKKKCNCGCSDNK